MNAFKENFSKLTSERLLEKRAFGGELADEAHLAIEEIFAERGEFLPARPIKPVNLKSSRQPKVKNSIKYVNILIALIIFIVSSAISKLSTPPWDLIIIFGSIGIYSLYIYLKRIDFSSEERTKEWEDKKILNDALNELMLVSANGDLARVIELLNFGADVNARSNNNSTALMFAARNNYLDIVKLLVKHGADINAKNDKGSTAVSIADNYGHKNIVDYLNALQAFKN